MITKGDLLTFEHDLNSLKKIANKGDIGLNEKEREALLVALQRVEGYYNLMLIAKHEFTKLDNFSPK